MKKSKDVLYFSKEFMDMLYMGSDWFNMEEYINRCFNSALHKKDFLAKVRELSDRDIDAEHIMWLLYNDLIVLADVAGFSTLKNAKDWIRALIKSLRNDATRYREIRSYMRNNSDLLENGLALDVKNLTKNCTVYEFSLKEIVVQLEQKTEELKKELSGDWDTDIYIKDHSFWRERITEAIDFLNSQACLYEEKIKYFETISYFLKELYPTIWKDDVVETIRQIFEPASKSIPLVEICI